MKTIQPCCAVRQFAELRNAVKNGGSADFYGYGDLSLAELLPAMMNRYAETDMLIAAPSLPDQAAEAVARWLRRQFARMDGGGNFHVIGRLTVIADLSEDRSPMASQWLRENPFGDRLTLIDRKQEDTVILLPDMAVTGPVNMRYGHPFTATVTTRPEDVAALWEKYDTPAWETSGKTAVKAEDAAVAVTDPAEDPAGMPVEKAAVPDELPAGTQKEEEAPKKEAPGREAGQQEGDRGADQTMI